MKLKQGRRAAIVLGLLFIIGITVGMVSATNSRVVKHAAPVFNRRQVNEPMQAALRDLRQVETDEPDSRDLYDVTRRLKLHRKVAINPYIRSTAPNYSVGREDKFFVANAVSGYSTLRAKLLLVTAHAYWYVDDSLVSTTRNLVELAKSSAADFENHVYPTNRAAFGHEWTPGIDRDPRITILSARLNGVGGYYSAEDLYTRAVNPYSNQRKMLYVDFLSYALGTPNFSSTVAHEFQHMIHWYLHERDDTWINEGSSVLAQVLNGHTADYQDLYFASHPGAQVDTFCYGPPYCSSDVGSFYYGASFQWMLYFYQHYGGNKALTALLADKALSGMPLFDDVLKRLGSKDNARTMFLKWQLANLIDDPSLAGGAYGYTKAYSGCCIHSTTTASVATVPATRSTHVNQFASDYVQVATRGHSTLHLQFVGDPTVALVANKPIQGGMEWYSARGDEMDSSLSRVVDLTRSKRASLSYDTWWDLEQDYDYGYVEVSTDHGVTWHTLRGSYTKDSNPNGSSYGNGYTGASTSLRSNRGGWVHEKINLGAYAGKKIVIRFETITDDAYNRPGMTLDNISIPEIGLVDRVGMGGWIAHGWIRIANKLPTQWSVQAVLYTSSGVKIQDVPIGLDGIGSATINGLNSSVQRIILAIAPTAPTTTESSSYTLHIT